MKNIVNHLLLLLSPILFFKNYVDAGEGVLIWHDWYRVSTFKCLKENSKEFVIVSANYYDSGEANLNAELNIINARTAGIENVDIYFSPCVKPSPEYDLCGNARINIQNRCQGHKNVNVVSRFDYNLSTQLQYQLQYTILQIINRTSYIINNKYHNNSYIFIQQFRILSFYLLLLTNRQMRRAVKANYFHFEALFRQFWLNFVVV
uniref:Uncharacterized protein n=1 Tax=Meloidogyne enterolobii TaxID=390850 RepID=A0A6V7WTT1_MELEN|nr:unnamed protein product [Meloidogyne enterolobii]